MDEIRAAFAVARKDVRNVSRYRFVVASQIFTPLYQGVLPALLFGAAFAVGGKVKKECEQTRSHRQIACAQCGMSQETRFAGNERDRQSSGPRSGQGSSGSPAVKQQYGPKK